jgi:hypothetical protein
MGFFDPFYQFLFSRRAPAGGTPRPAFFFRAAVLFFAMAMAKPLEQIIQQDCLPQKDCMLTLIDDQGEAAFLYFKEAELVEANYATLWGRDALMEILKWQVVAHTVAPLPLGIKRSLWDPLDYLLHPEKAASTSGRLPLPRAIQVKIATGSTALDRYKDIPHLLKIVQLDTEEIPLFEGPLAAGEQVDTGWLVEFAAEVRAVGETLGFGHCDKWTMETEKHQFVGFSLDERFVALMRRKDALHDDLETAFTTASESL